ncbi:MAG TPA: hypothetical protein VFW73_04155 [Lacipirellulaceae bacterium]|nr:hypothetical protein [Lacipirellulaceae bacterium]
MRDLSTLLSMPLRLIFEIRAGIRAERRAGDLLKKLARAKTPSPSGIGGESGKIVTTNDETQQSSRYAASLEHIGISRQTTTCYQRLADVTSSAGRRPEGRRSVGIIVGI